MSTTPKEGTGAPEGAAPAGGAPAGGAPAGAAPAKPKLVGGLSFSAGPAAPAGKLGGGLTFGAAAPPACTHDDHAGHDHSHGGHDHAHAHAERAVGKRPAETGGPAIQLDLEALLPGETDEAGRFEELDRALSRIPGVDAVHLRKDGAWPEVCLHYDPVTVTPDALVAAARTRGARVAKRFVQRTWFVVGMDSAQCGEVIEHVLGRTPGVLSAEVAYAAERLVVELDTELLSEKELVRKVEAIGYSLEEVVAGHACSHHGHDCGLAPKNGLNLVWGAGALILVGWALTLWVEPRLGNVAWAAALGCAGFYPIRSAFNAVRAGRIDIETLMVLAAGGAGLMGAWFEGAFLLFLFSLGHALEHRAMDRARKAVEALADLRPPTARVRRGVDVVEVPAEQVRVGDRVVVRPGDRVPVDGRIRDGRSTLDQAAITGESVPVAKAEGDDVFAGTINVDGALEVEATRLASDSTLARAVDLVAQAEARKPPAQRFTARIERMLVPMVLTAAPTLSLSLWWMGTPPTEAALRGISLLVAASPCALAVAVPSAVLSSVARAARAGVLIKGGVHLDALGTLRTVAFDKTGTLTVGKPRLVAVLPHAGTSEATLLQVAASAEALSGHPLAKAIVDGAAARALLLLPASDLDAVHGKGLRAVVDGAPVVIGNAALFDAARFDGALPPEVTAEVGRLHNDGVSTMIVARAGVVLGVLGVADTLRPEAAAVIAQLRGLGVDRVLMLSGDHARVAARVGAEVKVDEVRAPLLPEEKLRAIRQLARHGGVAMVGDGVNDAPALASAGVGVAMGGAGSDVALQSADVVLMADDLRRLPLAVALSRDAARVIRQNVALALGVAAVLVVASIGGWVQISQAVVLHEGSTLLVVLNGIRLLWWREPAPPAGELRGA